MTDTSKRNRQSAGQPTGGQFATEARGTDTGVSLDSGTQPEIDPGTLSMHDLERMEREGTLTAYATQLLDDFNEFVGANRDTLKAEERALTTIDTTDFLLRTKEDVPVSGLDPNDRRYETYLRIAHDVVGSYRRGDTRAAIDRIPQVGETWPVSALPKSQVRKVLPTTKDDSPATLAHTSHGDYWMGRERRVLLPVESLGEYAATVDTDAVRQASTDDEVVHFRLQGGKITPVADPSEGLGPGAKASQYERILDLRSRAEEVEAPDLRPNNGFVVVDGKNVPVAHLEVALGTTLDENVDSDRVHALYEFSRARSELSPVYVTHKPSGRFAVIQPASR